MTWWACPGLIGRADKGATWSILPAMSNEVRHPQLVGFARAYGAIAADLVQRNRHDSSREMRHAQIEKSRWPPLRGICQSVPGRVSNRWDCTDEALVAVFCAMELARVMVGQTACSCTKDETPNLTAFTKFKIYTKSQNHTQNQHTIINMSAKLRGTIYLPVISSTFVNLEAFGKVGLIRHSVRWCIHPRL